MSRLWSRFGVRALSIALLAVAVVGGVYVGKDREAQQREVDASTAIAADAADERFMKEYVAARIVATSRERAARRDAERKARVAARAAAERAKQAEQAASRKKAENTAPAKTPAFPGPIPASCNEFSGNRRTGCALMIQRGWPISQFTCLNRLWNRESGWNHRSRNASSGAFGIPQALPGRKMASAGADWQSNPATQIKWGLGYIKGRYGSPCKAWQHSEDVGWY